MKKKLMALVLCMLMAISLLPLGAYAEDNEGDLIWAEDPFAAGEDEKVEIEDISLAGVEATVEGPVIWIDESCEELHDYLLKKLTAEAYSFDRDLLTECMPDSSLDYATTLLSAGREIRPKLKNHTATIEVSYQAASSSLDTYDERVAALYSILNYSGEITTDPMEGDYVRKGMGGWSANWSMKTTSGTTYITYTIKPDYWGVTYTNEQQMSAAANKILSSLGFTSKTSGYDKIKAIYNWIGDNITYDYAALDNDSLLSLDQTAYSAIINRTTVCAGYSHLMYYMMWKSGIPCRIIIGTGSGGNHAWNMVWLRGKWYSMDVTWDAGYRLSDPCTFDWFLRGKDSGFYGSGSGSTHATNRDSSVRYNYTALVNGSSSSNYGGRKAADAGKCTAHQNAGTTYKTDNGKLVYFCSACGQSKVGGFSSAVSISSLTANKSTAKVGDTVTWTAAASGGSGTLQYCFYVLKDGTTVKKGTYGTGKTFSYKIGAAGTYTAKVFVKDSSGTAVNKTGGTVTVGASAPVTISSITANKSSANVGDTITWTAAASGGSGTLQYCFYIMKDGTTVKKGTYGTVKTFSYKVGAAGTYTAKVFVKDNSGTAVNKTGGTVTVGASAPLSIASVTANKSKANVGETITWTANNAAGGSGTLQYCFYIYKDGATVYKGSYGTGKSVSYKVASAGTYTAKAFVKDAAGTTVNKAGGTVTVTGTSAAITIGTIKAYQTATSQGNAIKWTATASGGSGTLQYCFYVYRDGEIVEKGTYGTSGTYVYQLPPMKVSGTYNYEVKVFVKDAAEAKTSKTGGAITITV